MKAVSRTIQGACGRAESTSGSVRGARVACCGDTQVKIVHRTGVELEVHLEVNLDRKPVIGHFLDKVEWDSQAKAFACSSTDGYLYVHELLD